MTYLVPFLLLLFPGMLLQGGPVAIAEAILAGAVLVIAVPMLLTGSPLVGNRLIDTALLVAVIGLAVWPHPITPVLAFAVYFGARKLGQRHKEVLA